MTSGTWKFTDHVCRVCFGRVLKCEDSVGLPRFRCSNCGIEGTNEVKSICCCGMKTRGTREIKIKCQRQENPTPEFPSEIVASEVR